MRVNEAIAILRDKHLEWSDDFESIRLALADLLEAMSKHGTREFDDVLFALTTQLLNDEVKTSTLDPLEEWIVNAARHLGYFELTSRRSNTFKNAVRRLFDVL